MPHNLFRPASAALRWSLVAFLSLSPALLFAPLSVRAEQVEGELPIVFEELILNGAGTRRLLFAELYTCRLFVPRKITSFDEARELNGPIEIHLEVHGEPPGKLPDDWAKVLDEELSAKLFEKARTRYRNLSGGDRVVVAYRPEEGSTVWLNDEEQFTDPGPGLVLALLEQWVGERPVSRSLRRNLLGQ